jgi:hypothetical protein
MTRYLPLGAAVALLAAVAIVQGVWTERWGKYDTDEIARRVYCLKQVPKEFGRWVGTDTPVDPHQLKIAKVSGVVQRSYKNQDTGAEVSIYLATGKARAISVHTPDKCYGAAGFRLAEDQVAVPVKYDDRVAEFYTGHFRKDTPEGGLHLRIFWSWNATGKWEAPAVPKITFAKYQALYKLYAIRRIQPGEQFLQEDPTIGFLRELLPILEDQLNRAEGPARVAISGGRVPAA